MNTYLKKILSTGTILFVTLFVPFSQTQAAAQLTNPLKNSGIKTIPDFVAALLNIVLIIGVPIVALGIIISGFMFVKAQGKPEELTKAKTAFIFTIVGAIILLGALVLAEAIGGTVQELTTGQ